MNLDPNMMRNLMKQLKMEDVPATEVIIKSENGNIVIKNPSVQKMNVQGKVMFQVTGQLVTEDEEDTIEVSEDDIKLVMQQAGCSEEKAIEALSESEGDIAGAILYLKNKK